MGLCGSKEVEISVTKTSGRPVGNASSKSEKKTGAKTGASKPRPIAKSKVAPIKGQKLGSSSGSAPASSAGDAKEMAALAAQQRLYENKKKNEKGQLGKKLAEDKRKGHKELALDNYNEKQQQQNLVYD